MKGFHLFVDLLESLLVSETGVDALFSCDVDIKAKLLGHACRMLIVFPLLFCPKQTGLNKNRQSHSVSRSFNIV